MNLRFLLWGSERESYESSKARREAEAEEQVRFLLLGYFVKLQQIKPKILLLYAFLYRLCGMRVM